MTKLLAYASQISIHKTQVEEESKREISSSPLPSPPLKKNLDLK